MNTFQIILKNMRQRALSTTLTILSVLLGVAIAIGILILQREGDAMFGQTDFGYELILGPATGSPMTTTLNSVYHLDQSAGVLPYSVYEDLVRKRDEPTPPGRSNYLQYVKSAVPIVVGDSVNGRRVVGTTPQMFGVNDDGSPIAPGTDNDGNAVDNRFQYRKGRAYELAEGRVFGARKFEAVIGADVARDLKLTLYDPNKSENENLKAGGAFQVTHGMPGPDQKPDIHKPRWRIVGILKPTGTANDRVLFVPFVSLFAIAEHENGLAEQAIRRAKLDLTKVPPDQREAALRAIGIKPSSLSENVRRQFGLATKPAAASEPDGDLMTDTHDHDHDHDDHDHDGDGHQDHDAADHDDHAGHDHANEPDAFTLDANGDIVPNLPQDQWALSAIFVKVRGGDFAGPNTTMLQYNFKVIDPRAAAVSPASVMREFFDTFLSGSAKLLLAISALVSVVAGASIATSIYNSVSARLREIAILRALGATRGKILAIICSEAALIGLIGGVAGLVAGHGLAWIASGYLKQVVGEDINWMSVDPLELAYLAAVVVLSFVAGLIPAMKAYRTPVATNLVAS